MTKFKSLNELFLVLEEKSLLAKKIKGVLFNNHVLSVLLDSELLTYWTTQANTFDLSDLNFSEKERTNFVHEILSCLREKEGVLTNSTTFLTQQFEEGTVEIIVQRDYMSITIHKYSDEDMLENIIGKCELEHSVYF